MVSNFVQRKKSKYCTYRPHSHLYWANPKLPLTIQHLMMLEFESSATFTPAVLQSALSWERLLAHLLSAGGRCSLAGSPRSRRRWWRTWGPPRPSTSQRGPLTGLPELPLTKGRRIKEWGKCVCVCPPTHLNMKTGCALSIKDHLPACFIMRAYTPIDTITRAISWGEDGGKKIFWHSFRICMFKLVQGVSQFSRTLWFDCHVTGSNLYIPLNKKIKNPFSVSLSLSLNRIIGSPQRHSEWKKDPVTKDRAPSGGGRANLGFVSRSCKTLDFTRTEQNAFASLIKGNSSLKCKLQ